MTTLYAEIEQVVGIHLPSPGEDIDLVANLPADRSYYPLVREAKRYFLWGFSGTPSAMSNKGDQLLVNVIEALIP